MIVRTLQEAIGTERDVQAETWYSRRLLLAGDNVGFSFHETVMKAGTSTTMWYKNHIEAVYCISGEGEIEDLTNGVTYPIRPGTLYVLNGQERHTVTVREDLRFICVFNPPVTGREVHGPDGAYPAAVPST